MGSLKGNHFAYSDTTLKLYRTQDSGADSTYIFESVNVEFHDSVEFLFSAEILSGFLIILYLLR